jgi:hypothetical protein
MTIYKIERFNETHPELLRNHLCDRLNALETRLFSVFPIAFFAWTYRKVETRDVASLLTADDRLLTTTKK